MDERKVLSYLGLAARAGCAVSGEFSTEKAVKSGKAGLVIVAADASENTKKKFRNKCAWYKVGCIEMADRERLGHALGKEARASAAITDRSLAEAAAKAAGAEI